MNTENFTNIINRDRKIMTPLIYDVLRMITIQFITQLLISLSSGSGIALLNETFLKTTLFLCLGVVIFWTIVFKFTSSNYLPTTLNVSKEDETY